MPAAEQVVVFGVTYKSRAAACRSFGHSSSKIDHRMRRGLSLEEALTSADRRQGRKKSPCYSHWNAMRTRCYSSSDCSVRYKEQGIKMCDRWFNDFWGFARDMGDPPGPGMSIDRIDNSKGYEPGNCRWVTRKEQQRNTTKNVHICVLGDTRTISEWSEISGICRSTISHRIKSGMSPEDAVTKRTRKGIKSLIGFNDGSLVFVCEKSDKSPSD